MTDAELKEVFIATLESVKAQIVYVRNLHDAFSALFDTLAKMVPDLEQLQVEEMRKIRPNPVQTEHIQIIDGLLAKLEKPQSFQQIQ